MAIPFSNTTQRIPPGFANLLEGLAREVLRNQPEDIPTFAAKYFETLLIEREKTGYDPSEWGAKIEDRFYNNHAFNELAPPGDGIKTKAEGGAPKVEEQVKKTSQETVIDLTEEQAAIKIQAQYRGYKTRKQRRGEGEGEGEGEGVVVKEPGEETKKAGEEEPSNEPDKKEPQ